MYQNVNSARSQFDKVMTEDQFNQIVEAIISGKYSWACLLVLRFAGYNPLHYIPYRTYNRLMKTHRELDSQSTEKERQVVSKKTSLLTAQANRKTTKLRDLACLEDIDRQSKNIKGGKKIFSWAGISNLIQYQFNEG